MKCAWCDEHAIVDIEVEPARYEKGTDPDSGLPVSVMRHGAIKAWACQRHMLIKNEQPPAVRTPHTTKAKDVDQLSIFDVPGVGPRSAIHGDER